MVYTRLSIILVLFSSVSGQDLGYDICNDMSHHITSTTVELYTPGYRAGKNYPNSTICRCTVESIKIASRDDSLSVTVKDLSLEVCSTSDTDWDILTIKTAYTFQPTFVNFVFCGNNKTMHGSMLRGPPGSGHIYGIDNTIYSLQVLNIDFQTDDTLSEKGALLEVKSEEGVVLQCNYVQGPHKPTYPPPTIGTITTQPEESGGLMSIIIGAIVGLLVIAAITVILAIIFIRKSKGKPIIPSRMMRGNVNVAMRQGPPQHLDLEVPSRPDTMRPVYIDPCGGQPSIPMPATAEGLASNDQYLYMENVNEPPPPVDTAVTPVYANPQKYFQSGTTADDEKYGYIVPGLQPNEKTHNEGEPLLIKDSEAVSPPSDRKSPETNIATPVAPSRHIQPGQNRMLGPPPAPPAVKINTGLSSCGSEEFLEKLDQEGQLKKPVRSKPVKPSVTPPTDTNTTPSNKNTNNDGIYSESLVKPSAFKTKSNAGEKPVGSPKPGRLNKPIAVISPSAPALSSKPTPPPAACKPATPPVNKKPTPLPTGNKPTPPPTGNKPTPPPTGNKPTPLLTGNKPTPLPTTKKPIPPPTGNKPTAPSPATTK